MSNAPFVIALHPSVPVRDLQGLVAYCKDNPGKLSYGHAGLGTTVHLAGELFKERASINILDVPYAGSAPAINDTIAGTVQMIIETSATLLPHHKSGRLRIITTMAEAREKIALDIPTSREAGYDLIAGTCNLLAAPLGTPAQTLEVIARAVSRVMEKPAVVDRLLQQGIQPISNSNPAQARAYVASEVARWSAVVKKLGIAL